MTRTYAPLYPMLATELDLRADDELLEVGCGSATLLAEQASQVRYVAGLDISPIQVEMARERLADRIAGGTAEIALGDARALPWADGRFSVLVSLNCLEFVPDPVDALREMHRVLRPDGRVVLTMSKQPNRWGGSGEIDEFGEPQWSPVNAKRLMDEAGFDELLIGDIPTNHGLLFVRGRKPAEIPVQAIPVPEVADTRELVGATR